MAKKAEVKKIRPSESINSLEEFNNRVLMLINISKSLISNNKIDKDFVSMFEQNVNAVNEFYEIES